MLHITFIAHGSNKAEANQFIEKLVTELDLKGRANVAFLELAKPDIPTALLEHIHNGALSIKVIPLFLSPGKHMKQDIPRIIAEVREKYIGCEIILEDFIGNHPEFHRMIAHILEQ